VSSDSGRRGSLQAWIWAGGVSVIVGIFAVVAWTGVQFFEMSRMVDDLVRAEPGLPTEFSIDEPVGWTVFVEPDKASLNGVRFRIRNVETNTDVVMSPYGGTFSYGFPDHTGRAVATVALRKGTYSLEVDGSGLSLAVGASPAARVAWMIIGGIAIGLPLVIGGGTVAVVSALRQSRHRNRRSAPPPASTWATGEWHDGRG